MDKKDKFVKKISIRIGLTLLIIGLLLGCIVFVRSLIKNMVGDITNIQKDYSDGLLIEATGTPTWLINGYKISGDIPYETFIQIIEELIKNYDSN